MDRIEAIIDAIGKLNGIHNPDSVAYSLRSPLLVRNFAPPGKNEVDDEGRRRFRSLQSGYKAAYFDVELKLQGRSRTRLNSDSQLTALLASYGVVSIAAVDNVISFLRRALKDPAISRSTPLSYFLTKG